MAIRRRDRSPDPQRSAHRRHPGRQRPQALCLLPDARFVYVLGELDVAMQVLPWDATKGILGQPVHTMSALPAGFTGKPWSADIHLTPDGRFLYASERNGSTLATFRVDPTTGLLTALGTIATETQRRGFAIDPSSRYLLAVGQLSGRMNSYAIDQTTGILTKVADIAVGTNPNWLEIVTLP